MQSLGVVLGVKGNPRSSETSPFDRTHMTSYLTLIETMRQSCTLFELLSLISQNLNITWSWPRPRKGKGQSVIPMLEHHMMNQCTKFEVSSFSRSGEILGGIKNWMGDVTIWRVICQKWLHFTYVDQNVWRRPSTSWWLDDWHPHCQHTNEWMHEYSSSCSDIGPIIDRGCSVCQAENGWRKFSIHRRFANMAKIDTCTSIYQAMLNRFSQSFHRTIAICVQMIDLALCTVGLENFSTVPTGTFTYRGRSC